MLNNKSLFLALFVYSILWGLGSKSVSSGGLVTENQAKFDAQYYVLNLKIDPASEYISGSVDVRIRSTVEGLDLVELDLIDRYKVESVRSEESDLQFYRKGHKLLITPSTPVRKDSLQTFTIIYHGKPPVAKKPPWKGGFIWSRDSNGTPWVGVSCQGEGAKIWWPCKDHPSDKPDSVAIHITVPDSLICAANGILEEVSDNHDGWLTYHWKTRYPISNYNVTINIADYAIHKRIYHGSKEMDIVFYVLKEATDGADSLLIEAENMLTFYAEHFGEYPFIDEKFGLAQTDYYGMEHQTLNSYGNKYRKTKSGYDFLMLHEMGHEWWGNKLTTKDWADFWLHEGIDIYAEAMFIEEHYGPKAYHEFFTNKARKKILNRKPIIPHKNATTNEAYTIDVYYKGAYVVRMLRYLIGKEALDEILKEFVTDSSYTFQNQVTTENLIGLIHHRIDYNLDWFFQQYLYQARLPVLKYKIKESHQGVELSLKWKTHNFFMPVEVMIKNGDRVEQQRLNVNHDKQTFLFPTGSELIVDPDGWILYETPQKALRKKFVKWGCVAAGIAGIITVLN